MKKIIVLSFLFVILSIIVAGYSLAACDIYHTNECSKTCQADSDCKLQVCGCYNKNENVAQPVGSDVQCLDIGNCICKNSICYGSKQFPSCGNGTCENMACLGVDCPIPENNVNCPQDCGNNGQQVCGNGKCEGMENNIYCPGCAQGTCPPCVKNCPQDCKTDNSVCGNGACEQGEAYECPACVYSNPGCEAPCKAGTCPQDCKGSPVVGGDKDEHGCIGSAGYVWCKEKQKCLRPWEEECSVNSKKVKIMPEVASQKAIEKLGDLGFNVQLKETGNGKDKKYVYEATGEKEVNILWFFPVKMKVSTEVNTETGEVSKIKKPWWSFLVF